MKKQKYRFTLTRVHSARVKYNTGVLTNGEYYSTYDYNCTERITPEIAGDTDFMLSDEFIGHAIGFAVYDAGDALVGYNDFFIVDENNRTFHVSDAESIVFFWNSKNFAPPVATFFQYETRYVHPVFSKLNISSTRQDNSMSYTETLNSDLYFKAGAFDYIESVIVNYALVFKIERYNYNTQEYVTIYTSTPFTKADCALDYDRRQLTVDFSRKSYSAYLESQLNSAVNIAKSGYEHSALNFNIPAMLQVYVDGSETVTNIVGGSAVDVDAAYIETPDDFTQSALNSGIIYSTEKSTWVADNIRTLYLLSLGFWLSGRISELHIVGGNYTEPGESIIDSPAGYYYATTSDNQISQVYQPTNSILRFYSDTTKFYIEFDQVARLLHIKKLADDTIVYTSSQLVNTTCLLSPDSITGLVLRNVDSQTDACSVDFHNTHSIFSRILTTKNVPISVSAPYTNRLSANDFAYSGAAYKYAVFFPITYNYELFSSEVNNVLKPVHLFSPIRYEYFYLNYKCSSAVALADQGLGAINPNQYYTYKNKQGSTISQHYIPIGRYFWTGISFYATLPNNFITILNQWYNLVTQHHFFTIGTAITDLLQKVAPNIKFAQTWEYSKILYGNYSLQNIDKPDIYLTHASNIQAGLFNMEAQHIELTLKKVFDMLRDAFQIYYYVDSDGKLHLEHISWFYIPGVHNAVQYDTMILRDAYTKVPLNYGAGQAKAEPKYLYSTFKIAADSEDATELFSPLEISCEDELCKHLGDRKEITLQDFVTDIDYIYASASERADSIVVLMPSTSTISKYKSLTYSAKSACYIKGNNDYLYTLWPTNYRVTSFALLQYYNWNFASLTTNHCAYLPQERARYLEQEIQVPVDSEIDMQKLINTQFGEGFILSYTIDLDSRYAIIKLLHKG